MAGSIEVTKVEVIVTFIDEHGCTKTSRIETHSEGPINLEYSQSRHITVPVLGLLNSGIDQLVETKIELSATYRSKIYSFNNKAIPKSVP